MPDRLLARRSEMGYVDHPARAMRAEPEPVTQAEQDELTRAAHGHASDQREQALHARRQDFQRQLDYHAAQARHAERELARLNRRIDAPPTAR